jgi:uncharacterized protein with FMN-binding domain
MKRAAIVTGVTVVGAAWLLSYKVLPQHLAANSNGGPSPDAGAATPSPSGGPSATPSPSAPPKPSGTFTGSDVPNRFGDVQVRVVISNGRITDVQAVQLPSDRAQSAYISQVAGPMLRTEALQAQSAHIDIISGATYTSDSYAQSLETALQQAHMG